MAMYNKYHGIAFLSAPIVLPFIFVYQTCVKLTDTILGTEYSYHQIFWGGPNKKCNLESCYLCNGSREKEIIIQKEEQEKIFRTNTKIWKSHNV